MLNKYLKFSVFAGLTALVVFTAQVAKSGPDAASIQLPQGFKLSVFANTCYSYVSDASAMHVANVYRYDAAKKIMASAEGGGVSAAPSVEEGEYAKAWAKNIWTDTLT